MLLEIPRNDSDEAIIQITDDLKSLLALAPKLKHNSEIPNPGIDLFVSKFAIDPKNLTLGKLITRFMQFPSVVSPSLFLRISDSRPYNGNTMGFVFRLMNRSDQPLKIEYHLHTQVVRKIKKEGVFAETDRWNSKPVFGMLEPGESVDLNAHFANLNLYRLCREAREPIYWDGCGVKTVLEEIGYSFDYSGQRVESWNKSSWPTGVNKDSVGMKIVKNGKR